MAMRLPSNLTYNDLNGLETREILSNWFMQFLASQPALQAHLTLPNARINLEVAINVELFVGGTVPIESPPEQLLMRGNVGIVNSSLHDAPPDPQFKFPASMQTTINVAPVAGGNPPDQVREQHGLPIPTPGYGSRETGSHLFVGDINSPQQAPYKVPEPPINGGRVGIVSEGYKFSDEVVVAGSTEQSINVDKGRIEIDLTGQGKMRHVASVKEAGDQKGSEYGSVSGTYDAGPAGLASHRGGGGLYSDGRSRIRFGNNH
jgi:hypothetical protein